MPFSSPAHHPIGIFDSGVGGLTVVQQLQRSLPHELLCYFGDTARVPYGVKSAETVTRYSLEITRFLSTHQVKAIVIACNTASSLALEAVQALYDGPVIGVVEPGVRAALNATRNGRIGIIGTRSTITSQAYQKRLHAHNPAVRTFAEACPLLVPLAEEGWFTHPVSRTIVEQYLTPLLEQQIDVLILGCTHFPLLADLIQSVAGDSIRLVSSAEEVTREVQATLAAQHLLAPGRLHHDLFYASDDIRGFQDLGRMIGTREPASYMEVNADFFTFIQQLPDFQTRIHADPASWFLQV